MAVKKAKVKAKARRAAPRAKATGAAKAARAKAKSKPKVVAKAPRAKGKSTPKRKATKPKRGRRAAAEQSQMELFASEPSGATEAAPPKTKKGAFARLASGVGSLFARVTGKNVTDSGPSRTPEETLELSSTDILAVTAAPPPPPKAKR